MKPPKFEYFAPETLAEATALLAEHGEDAQYRKEVGGTVVRRALAQAIEGGTQ